MYRQPLQETVNKGDVIRAPSLAERGVHDYGYPFRRVAFCATSAREHLDLRSAKAPGDCKTMTGPLVGSRLFSTAALFARHRFLHQCGATLQRICTAAAAGATERCEQSRHPARIVLAIASVTARTSTADESWYSARPSCDLLAITVCQPVMRVEREHVARRLPAR